MVIVFAGQRSAHSPQRIQRVSSFNIADGDASDRQGYVIKFEAEQLWAIGDGVDDVGLELDAVERDEFKAVLRTDINTSTACMQSVPSCSLPSKMVLIQHFRQRCASAIASCSL